MARRSMFWKVVAVLFALVNVGGAIYAFMMGEMLHGGIHVALLIPAVPFLKWAFASAEPVALPERDPVIDDRLKHMQHAIDAIAIEAERVGAGQRQVAELFAERAKEPVKDPVKDPVKAPVAPKREE